MLTVVTFLWSKPGYRSKFTRDHVRTMARMVARHYDAPHRFVCFNDLGSIFNEAHAGRLIEWRPLWGNHADVTNPHGDRNPSCYRRLRLFSEWARQNIGERILCIDLDMVLVDDVRPLWDRPEEFVFWADQLNPHGRINGAMQLITPGVRDHIWSRFDPAEAQRVGKLPGFWGSDQGWIAWCFQNEHVGGWTTADGALSWRVHCKPVAPKLPGGARCINFHGPEDPWTISGVPWIAEHYR